MVYLCSTVAKHTDHISMIYAILYEGPTKLPYKVRWERDLGEELEAVEWGKLAQFKSKPNI